jgi:hypothetical protein
MIVLLGMAAVLPACHADDPALTLVFVALPDDAESIVV